MNPPSPTLVSGRRDEQGRLHLRDDQGRLYSDVLPARLFPLTDPDGWLSLRDREGHELLCLSGMDAVAPELRPLIEEELDRLVFIPVITGIRRSVSFGHHVRLLALTDRGEVDLTVAAAEIHRMAGHRILLKDDQGIRYLIPDWRALREPDRKLLEVYL